MMIGLILLFLFQTQEIVIFPENRLIPEKTGTTLIQSVTGEFYVSDKAKSRIYHLGTDGKLLNEYGGTGSGTQFLNQPAGIWCSNDLKVYVADMNNHRIVILSRELALIGIINGEDPSSQDLSFRFPKGVVISPTGDIFILDGDNNNILKVSASTGRRERLGDMDSGFSLLGNPESLTSAGDRLFVFDSTDSSIVALDWFGNVTNQLPAGSRYPMLIENDMMLVDRTGMINAGNGGNYQLQLLPEEIILSVFVRGVTVSILTNRSILIASILAQ